MIGPFKPRDAFGAVDQLKMLTEAIDICHMPHDISSSHRFGLNKYQCGNTTNPSWARYGLPYSLELLDDERALLVNRDYKPFGLGIPYSMHVDYEAFPQWWIADAALARIKRAPCWYGPGKFFLFNDGNPPWVGTRNLRAYADRLDRLRAAWVGTDPNQPEQPEQPERTLK